MKQSGLLKRQKEEQKKRDRLLQDATRQTFVQYMTDTLIFTLNDPEVMGKDVFGYARIKKVLDAWGKNYDKYFEALTMKAEADYFREKMDEALRRIIPEGEPFVPFEGRYDWLPEILYGEKKGGRGLMNKTSKALSARERNRMNRHQGRDFEKLIEAACAYYRVKGVADIEKTPEAMKPIANMGNGKFVAVYTEKAQADFKGLLKGGRAVNFEAKHTATERMEQDRVTPEQAARLRRIRDYGGKAFVICSFSGLDFFRIPWSVWENMKGCFGHKYFTVQDVEQWRIRIGGPGVLLFLEGLEEK